MFFERVRSTLWEHDMPITSLLAATLTRSSHYMSAIRQGRMLRWHERKCFDRDAFGDRRAQRMGDTRKGGRPVVTDTITDITGRLDCCDARPKRIERGSTPEKRLLI